MKLDCEVELVYIGTNNINCVSTKRRAVKSTLALGSGLKDSKSYFLLHFSSVNKHGTRYKIEENIQQVFAKFHNEGKATIRFVAPSVDLCVRKSDPKALVAFLKTLKLILNKDHAELKGLNLSNISKNIKPSQSKLCIKDASQYPIKGLPKTLETLDICGIGMHTFKREILTLKNLKHLNLEGNNLVKIPKEFGTLPNVMTLNLARNQLGNRENSDWTWMERPQIQGTLGSLDLSGNNIGPYVPCGLSSLSRLVTLILRDNNITKLPHHFIKLSSLRYLYMSGNKLSCLPGNIRLWKLSELDISGNRRCETASDVTSTTAVKFSHNVMSLKELSGACILNNCIGYTKGMIPLTLIYYLNASKYCVCGKAVFRDDDTCQFIQIPIKSFFQSFVHDDLLQETSLECYFCSFKCYKDRSRFFA